MKTINDYEGLEPYGIKVTGTGWKLKHRLVCDVTAKGKTILEKIFNKVPIEGRPDNRGTPDNRYVGFVVLDPDLWPAVAAAALLESGCTEVWIINYHSLYGFERLCCTIPDYLAYSSHFAQKSVSKYLA